MKILVFGNPLVEEDSLALKIAKVLAKKFPEIDFKELDAVEEIQNEGKNPVILDVVQGIRKPVLLSNFDQLKTEKIYSMHDFDLGMTLKLLKKLGFIETVKIIAVPISYDKKKALEETKIIISSLFSESV